MGKITFPPGSQGTGPLEETFAFNEPLTLRLNTSGYFSHDNQQAFAPNLPIGNLVSPLDMGPYYAVPMDNVITLRFFDTANGRTYKTRIVIGPPSKHVRDR